MRHKTLEHTPVPEKKDKRTENLQMELVGFFG